MNPERTETLERRIFSKLKNGNLDELPWDQYILVQQDVHELVFEFDRESEPITDINDFLRQHPKVLEVIARHKDVHPEDNGQELMRIFTTYNYVRFGSRDFHVCGDLAALLRDTDMPLAPSTELRLPFEALSIFFGRGVLQMPGWDQLDRVVLTSHQDKHLVGFLIGDDGPGAPAFRIHLRDDYTFSDIAKAGKGGSPVGDQFFSLFVNTIMYINSEGADVVRDETEKRSILEKLGQATPKTRRHKELQKRYKEAKSKYIYLVGKNVVAQDTDTMQAANEEGRKLMTRFRVRGHWRNQVHGPKSSLRKRIWLRPFWKGPEMAELINKGYVVKMRGKEA